MALDFRTLFDAEAPAVLARLQRLGVPLRDRLDLAQDVFLDVSRSLARLDPARPVRPWLVTITCNKARDYHKRARVRLEQLVGLEAEDVPAQEDRVLDRFAAAALVRRILRSLRYDDREVLTLVDLEERSVPEVAELLSVSVKTIEMRVGRARERFAAALERMQAKERRVLGEVAALFGAARQVDEDLGAEVEQLRARMERVLRPVPRVQAPAPIAAWVGLVAITFVASVGAVDGLARPRPVIGPECPPAATIVAAAIPAEPPAVSTVPTAELVTGVPSVAVSSMPARSARSQPPAPAATSTAAAAVVNAITPVELSEGELLRLARRALHEGSPTRARVYLLRHARAYPNGSLVPEREALLARVKGS